MGFEGGTSLCDICVLCGPLAVYIWHDLIHGRIRTARAPGPAPFLGPQSALTPHPRTPPLPLYTHTHTRSHAIEMKRLLSAARRRDPPSLRAETFRRESSKFSAVGRPLARTQALVVYSRIIAEGWRTALTQTYSSRRGTAAATPAAAATLFASRAGRRCRSCGGRRTSSLMGRCGLCGTPGRVGVRPSPLACAHARYISSKSRVPWHPAAGGRLCQWASLRGVVPDRPRGRVTRLRV